MNEPLSDEELRALFTRQRAADHEQAPTFCALCGRSQSTEVAAPAAFPPVWRWALSGAVALGLGIAAVLSFHQTPRTAVVSHETLTRELDAIDVALRKSLSAQNSVTAWQSPTDFILNPTPTETP
jgi:hypothetical protein